MLYRNLIIFILLISFIYIFPDNYSEDVKNLLNEFGFSENDIMFEKAFAKNDTFLFPLADSILNNPYIILKRNNEIFDSLVKLDEINEYKNIDNIYELIDSFSMNITRILRENINMEFDKTREIVSVIPLMFFEESLSYIYKYAIERNMNLDIDSNNLTFDSIFNYTQKIDIDCRLIRSHYYSFLNRVFDLYSDGKITENDTILESGRIVIGGVNDNTYNDDYDFILDLGGNDTYINQNNVIYPYTKRVKILIDFSGNDEYISSDSFAVSYSAIDGASFLYDFSGNDIYRTSNISLGSAFIGFASLIDNTGNDIYNSGLFSQGASFYGYSELIDNNGNDFYSASGFAQGFGFVKGIGILIDSTGDDTYRAGTFIKHEPLLVNDYLSMSQGFGFGLRNRKICGGIGILADYNGNDVYHSSVFGQGASYWHSIGLLFDFNGNDYYSSAEYAQGAGIHLSVGGLFDYNGDDMYFSRYGPSQGEGHDFAVGVLVDKNGDDTYTVSGGQGVGLTNSVGIFIDYKGKDSYYTREGLANGDANIARDFYGIGIFADMEGKNFYSDSNALDNSKWINNYYSLGYDDTLIINEEYKDTFNIPDTINIEDLFDIASEWGVRENKFKVEKAREKLINRKEEALNYILENKLNTNSGLELRAIVSFFKDSTVNYNDTLLSELNKNDSLIIKNVLYLMGELKINNFEILKQFSKNKKYSYSLIAINSMSKIDSIDNLDYLESIYRKSDYRKKISILNLLKKKKYNLLNDFYKYFATEKRPVSYALADYFSVFDTIGLNYFLNDSILTYEKLISIYKIIQNDSLQFDTLKLRRLIINDNHKDYNYIRIKSNIEKKLKTP